jgi:protein involved in polysaccharide export with SLBB domain
VGVGNDALFDLAGDNMSFHRRRIRSHSARVLFQGIVSRGFLLLCSLGAGLLLTGCGPEVRKASPEEIAAFQSAGPEGPSVDMDRLVQARIPLGPYRVVPGDILLLEMPRVLDPQLSYTAGLGGERESYKCRVSDVGAIVLPVVGQFAVAGKSLAEIESSIMAEYYPKYIKTRFPVFVSVLEYKTYRVSVAGAVARMGLYNLRHDQMSLLALLMEAGGIVDSGAAVIRIAHAQESPIQPGQAYAAAAPPTGIGRGTYPWIQPSMSRLTLAGESGVRATNGALASGSGETVVLPVRGLSIPAADVALQPGDSVVVERPTMQYVVVLGLVNRSESFPYPPNAQYTLIQALGLAGGLDAVADPRYVTVYRLTAEGTVVSTTVEVVNPSHGEHLTDALALPLKPGDVVYVEHTLRTRTNVFFDRIFRISLGLYLTPDDLNGGDRG